MNPPLSIQTVGVLGALGVLLLLVWAAGFFFYGVHAGGWHVLVPVGILLVVAQGVRRVSLDSDAPD